MLDVLLVISACLSNGFTTLKDYVAGRQQSARVTHKKKTRIRASLPLACGNSRRRHPYFLGFGASSGFSSAFGTYSLITILH